MVAHVIELKQLRRVYSQPKITAATLLSEMASPPPTAVGVDVSFRGYFCLDDGRKLVGEEWAIARQLARNYKIICTETFDGALRRFIPFGQYLDRFCDEFDSCHVWVDRWYPSTKTCSACFGKHRIPRSARAWKCSYCGAAHDRDVNAAKNILREGVRLCGLKVKHVNPQ